MEDRIYRRNEAFREDRFPVTDYGNWFAPYDYSPKIDILSFQNQLQIDNVILGGKLQNINNFLNLANPPIEPVGLTYNPEAFEANSGSNFSASGAAIWNLYGNSYANEIFIVSNAFLNSIKEGVTGRPLLRIPYNNTIICVVFRFYKNRSIIMERWS